MIAMSCPSCGRAGQCPKEKVHTRLVCRKCHVVFHLDASGRAVIGDPNQPVKKEVKKKAKEAGSLVEALHLPKFEKLNRASDNLSEYGIPVKQIAALLGVLVVFWGLYSIANAAPEAVADPSRRAAEALAQDNLSRLKSYATDETRDELPAGTTSSTASSRNSVRPGPARMPTSRSWSSRRIPSRREAWSRLSSSPR